MNSEEKEDLQYRFSGYQFNMIQLDGTGNAYIYEYPHPYYYNQPAYGYGPRNAPYGWNAYPNR